MDELWKTIDTHPFYEVSNLGRVRRCGGGKGALRGRILKPHTSTSPGYLNVRLFKNNKGTGLNVHRLVARMFLGLPAEGMQVRHLDGDRLNNLLTNLCYGTPLENSQDTIRHGRAGRRKGRKALTAEQAFSIASDTRPLNVVAADHGVCRATIYRKRAAEQLRTEGNPPMNTPITYEPEEA